jgi:hypothetical protein
MSKRSFIVSTAAALLFSLAPTIVGDSGDIEQEVWWTTTHCPPGVASPCLDGTVSASELPAWAQP